MKYTLTIFDIKVLIGQLHNNNSINMKLDVLAIGAHPDDIELACGGTVARLVQKGHHVGIVDLTRGELGTRGSKEIREQEAADAAKVLGIDVRINLDIPDGNVQITNENTVKLIEVIRTYKPDILFIPHWLERHPDHEHAHTLGKEAWYYAGLEKIQTFADGVTQEPHRPKKYYHFRQRYDSFIIDITDQIEIRMNAVRCFRSQFFDPTSKERETLLSRPDFLEVVESRLRYFGSMIGTKFGEPFFSVEPIGLSDLFHIV